MRARTAIAALGLAALFAARPADSRPIRPGDDVARLQAENASLQRQLDRDEDALGQIARANRRSKDRMTRRAIDRILDGLLDDRGEGDHDRDAAQPMSDDDFQHLLGRVAAAGFESGRVDLVKTAAQGSRFTSAQVVALMQQSGFDDTRIEIAATLYPRVVDPAGWSAVYAALDFDTSRDTLRQRVGQ